MQNFKIEIAFIREGEAMEVLHSFEATGTSGLPTLIFPNIGEQIAWEVGDKKFGGEILAKVIVYGDKDFTGKPYDLVMRIILTVTK